jgi:hypothetical protein
MHSGRISTDPCIVRLGPETRLRRTRLAKPLHFCIAAQTFGVAANFLFFLSPEVWSPLVFIIFVFTGTVAL